MRIHILENRRTRGWTTFGGYWPRGAVQEESFRLTDSTGNPVPVQSEIAARWPDGSVKWSRHTARAEALGESGELTPGAADIPEELAVTEEAGSWTVTGPAVVITIPKAGSLLAAECRKEGRAAFRAAYPVLMLAHVREEGEEIRSETCCLKAEIRERALETAGPLETVFRFDGVHIENGTEKMPFRIRMYVRADGEIAFDDTFFFLGDPEQDRLAGWGLRFETSLTGRPYQRQIRLLTDGAMYKDNPTQLFHWRKRLDPALLAAQQRGETVAAAAELDEAAEDLPRWDRFCLTQDSADRYVIRKKAWAQGCWLDGPQGRRAPGTAAVSDPERTLSIHLRDFWEKHPAGLEITGLSAETTALTAWFYAPQAAPFDFRHYDRRTYPMGCYEGFDYMRADPRGIAVTCRAAVYPESGYAPDESLQARSDAVALKQYSRYAHLSVAGFLRAKRIPAKAKLGVAMPGVIFAFVCALCLTVSAGSAFYYFVEGTLTAPSALNVTLANGPYKGIRTTEEVRAVYEGELRDYAMIAEDAGDGYLYVISDESWPYIYAGMPCSAYSTWFVDQDYYFRQPVYWSIFPDKLPEYMYLPKYNRFKLNKEIILSDALRFASCCCECEVTETETGYIIKTGEWHPERLADFKPDYNEFE